MAKKKAAKLPYDPQWDITSIPFEAIPDEQLRSWWAMRNVRKRPLKETDDPEERKRLDANAAAVQRWRQRQKKAKNN